MLESCSNCTYLNAKDLSFVYSYIGVYQTSVSSCNHSHLIALDNPFCYFSCAKHLIKVQMDQSPAAAGILVAVKLAFQKWALISAVKAGHTGMVVDLLDGGVPIDTKDDEGMSLLHWAAWGGHVTTLRLLIRRGSDVNSVDSRGLTPLHWAASMGQTKTVRELISNRASKSVVVGEYGTPLDEAAIKGHLETVVAMLEEGCPLDIVNSIGATVLHSAAAGGNVDLVRELVVRG